MKTLKNNYNRLNALIFLLTTLFLFSCSSSKFVVPEEYVGKWQSERNRITVRTKPDKQFQFTSDSAIVTIEINNDNTVSGFIGMTAFETGQLIKNAGLPRNTGVAFIVECGSIGKIFNNDPLDAKEVDIWLGPVNENGNIKAEIRYTERSAAFPMAGILLYPIK